MELEHRPTQALFRVVSSAREFGLTSHEVWESVMVTPGRLPADLRARYTDELAAELAERLLEKQRASQDPPRSTHTASPPPRSPLVSPGSPGGAVRTGFAHRCFRWARRYRPN